MSTVCVWSQYTNAHVIGSKDGDGSTTITIEENGQITQEGHFTQLPYYQFQQFLVSVFLEMN